MRNVYLDDVEIVCQFIEGEETLVANESLHIQATLDTAQLLARNGQIVAIARLQSRPSTILIQRESEYVELLHQVLEAYEYVPVRKDTQTQFQQYEHHAVPVGYQLHCAAARELWRQWGGQRRHNPVTFFPDELQLLSQDQWCPIQDIAFNQGTLFVKTTLGETIHPGNDLLVWIEQQAEEGGDEPTQFLTADMAAEQGYLTAMRCSRTGTGGPSPQLPSQSSPSSIGLPDSEASTSTALTYLSVNSANEPAAKTESKALLPHLQAALTLRNCFQ